MRVAWPAFTAIRKSPPQLEWEGGGRIFTCHVNRTHTDSVGGHRSSYQAFPTACEGALHCTESPLNQHTGTHTTVTHRRTNTSFVLMLYLHTVWTDVTALNKQSSARICVCTCGFVIGSFPIWSSSSVATVNISTSCTQSQNATSPLALFFQV